ncbi:MAG: FlgD immunoglobulin-like domain containing protein [bacterium]
MKTTRFHMHMRTISGWLLAVGLLLGGLAPVGATETENLGIRALPTPGVPITYNAPRDGRVTIAINDASGRRVRNLIADVPVTKGTHQVTWDGLNDKGHILPPGSYKWVGLARGDLHAIYRGRFAHGTPPWYFGNTGGWLADHYPPCAVIGVGDGMFIGSGVTEGGHGLVRCDLDGNKQWGKRWLSQAAWCNVASMASEGERIFATTFPNWQQSWVWEVDPKTGDSWPIVKIAGGISPSLGSGQPAPVRDAPYDGMLGLRVVGAHHTGPTRWDGEVFVSDVLGDKPRTFVYPTSRAPGSSPADTRGYYNGDNNTWNTVSVLRVLPVRVWGMTWLPDGRCIAVLDNSLAVIDTKTGATTPLVTDGLEAPYAITSDAQGRLFVSDRGGQGEWDSPYGLLHSSGLRISPKASMQVKIFDSQGRRLATIGRKGGQQPGVINPLDLYLPGGLATDARGRLWLSEETGTKRISVWDIPADLAQNKPLLSKEYLGTSSYGEGAYMLDPMHPNRITSDTYGITWDLDLTAGTFHPVELPRVTGLPDMFSSTSFPESFPFGNQGGGAYDSWLGFTSDTVAFQGHTYQWYSRPVNGYAVVGEKTGSGQFKPMAAFGTVFNYLAQSGRYSDHWVPLAILEAAKRSPDWDRLARANGLDPKMTDFPHVPDLSGKWPREFNAFNWTDANGDGLMQPEEIALSRLMAHHGAQVVMVDKQLNVLISVYGTLYWMKPQEIGALGAPKYDWTKAEPCSLGTVGSPTAVLADGSFLITSPDDNLIRLVGPDGKQRWSYPTAYNSHSHRNMTNQRERVTQPGAIYGVWNMQGVVSGPGTLGQFAMIHSGHGMNYLMTTDGLFIGTVFKSGYDENNSWDNQPEAKPGMLMDNFTLGDECFNGSIARAEATAGGFEKGHYYLLGLGRRVVVELTGMDTVQRLPGGAVKLAPASVKATRQQLLTTVAQQWAKSEQGNIGDIIYAKDYSGQFFWDSTAAVFSGGRACLWYNEAGLGIGGFLDYRPGTPLTQVFTHTAPSWEQDYAYGESLNLQIGANPPAGSGLPPSAIIPQRLVFSERNGKLEVVRYRWLSAAQTPAGAKPVPEGRDGGSGWVAELLDLPAVALTRTEPIYYNTSATFQMTIPWKTLGIDYKPGMALGADIGCTRRTPGGGLTRANWVSDVQIAAYDDATTLAMQPDLWRTFVLRPAGYVLPPAPGTAANIEKGKPLPVHFTKANNPVLVSYGDASTWISTDAAALKLKWYVKRDTSPFANHGDDVTLLFKSGDGCDLQIESPTLGKCRYLIAMYQGKPTVVRYRFQAKDAKPEQGVWFRSPAGELFVPVVEQLPLEPKVARGDSWYTVEVALPWDTLGIVPRSGLSIPAELGVLASDPAGTITTTRYYWNSGLIGMVKDVPSEAKPTDNWGGFRLD